MDFKCGVDPVKRFLAGLAGSVADSVQLAERPPAPLVEAPAPAPNAAAPAPARGAVCGPGDGRGLWRGLRRRAAAGRRRRARRCARTFLLLMRAQTLLPAPTKALLKFYAKAWDEAPPAHWSDVIAGSATRARPGHARRGGGARRGLVRVCPRIPAAPRVFFDCGD